jgi:hypothetical protein
MAAVKFTHVSILSHLCLKFDFCHRKQWSKVAQKLHLQDKLLLLAIPIMSEISGVNCMQNYKTQMIYVFKTK